MKIFIIYIALMLSIGFSGYVWAGNYDGGTDGGTVSAGQDNPGDSSANMGNHDGSFSDGQGNSAENGNEGNESNGENPGWTEESLGEAHVESFAPTFPPSQTSQPPIEGQSGSILSASDAEDFTAPDVPPYLSGDPDLVTMPTVVDSYDVHSAPDQP